MRSIGPFALPGLRRWWVAHPRITDVVLAVALLGLSATIAFFEGRDGRPGPGPGRGPGIGRDVGLDTLTALLLAVAAGALVLRRDRPVVGWGVGVLAAGGVVLHGAEPRSVLLVSLVSLYTVGVLASLRTTLLATLATTAVYGITITVVDGIFGERTVTVLALLAAAAAVGVAVRAQRLAVVAAEARARQAERTREEEADRRVTDERLRIARELHDVLAHHISVINVQAGVARHLLDADPEQARTAMGLVRESSRTVLTEMRTVVGLLRTGEDGLATQPAPGLSRVADLVESMTSAGLHVTWQMTGAPGSLGELVDLTAYRLVQESLTNALRHGTGTADLDIAHRDDVLVVQVTNPLPGGTATPADPAGGGHGLMGMRERVAAVGGRLSAGPTLGSFTVRAQLPRGAA